MIPFLDRRRSQKPLIISWIAIFLSLGLVTTALAFTDDQAKQGEQIFGGYCSTCHGNRGQGLTAEFRATWPPQDQNCWKSKCHADNHPPSGFVLPKTVPAIIGPGTLQDMATAQNLHDFISKNMPYQAPGLLNQDQYWALTAYLLRQRGIAADGQVLNNTNAARIQIKPEAPPAPPGAPFHPPSMPPQKPASGTPRLWLIVGVVLVAGSLAAFLVYRVLRSRLPGH